MDLVLQSQCDTDYSSEFLPFHSCRATGRCILGYYVQVRFEFGTIAGVAVTRGDAETPVIARVSEGIRDVTFWCWCCGIWAERARILDTTQLHIVSLQTQVALNSERRIHTFSCLDESMLFWSNDYNLTAIRRYLVGGWLMGKSDVSRYLCNSMY